MADPRYLAKVNLETLRTNSYPGRGIIMGLDQSGKAVVQASFVMGRSENSRNRVFGHEGGLLFTEAADPTKVKDPSLIIYNAMSEHGSRVFVVSNGKQTDAMIEGAKSGLGLVRILEPYQYEPDPPIFTPRITAVSYVFGGKYIVEMALLRKSPFSHECDKIFYSFGDMSKGFGYCMTTYQRDGNPPPPFQGEPYLLPLEGNGSVILDTLWGVLNPDNRVSLAVKFINLKTGASEILIKNKYNKVG